jgi:FdhD protein
MTPLLMPAPQATSEGVACASPPTGVRQASVTNWRGGRVQVLSDWLAEEAPVALVFNGISQAVMMATPADFEDFALGFGLTEGLLLDASELYGVEVAQACEGIEVQMEVSSACLARLKERRRTLAGRTGCGLCGTDSLAQVRRTLPTVVPLPLAREALAQAQRTLRSWQSMQQLTGASHAAAWCNAQGDVQVVREDVGRHNALDKLVGALVRERVEAAAGFICITSRASFEMVQKAAMAGVGTLAAVSAPTALAVDTAVQCGLALAGFVRGDDFVAYTQPQAFGLGDTGDTPWM